MRSTLILAGSAAVGPSQRTVLTECPAPVAGGAMYRFLALAAVVHAVHAQGSDCAEDVQGYVAALG